MVALSTEARQWVALAALMTVVLVWPVAALAAEGQDDPRPAEKLSVEDVSVGKDAKVKVKVAAPGELPNGVPDDAFTVTEDGQPRDVRVRRIPSDGLQVVLALDTSGSVAHRPLRVLKSAALSFVRSMPPQVPIAVVAFGNKATPLTELTRRRAPVRRAIKGLTAGGRTALFDGLITSLAAFDEQTDARRVVVLMADGEDNRSSATLKQTRAAVRRHDAVLYTVQLDTAYTRDRPLRTLTKAGGGRVLAMKNADRLVESYGEVASKLVNRYELTYRSDAEGETEVQVQFEHDGVVAEGSRKVLVPQEPPGWSLFGAWSPRALRTMTWLWVVAVIVFVVMFRRLRA